MIEITSHTISANSCAIHYLRAGAQDDPIVILLHGMKFQASTWKELGTLEHLAGAGFQVIAMDMPGFGGSPACSAEQDSVLEAFLREIDRPAILVGPSMGGRIALEFTIRHQNLVSALVLVGAVGVEENRSRLSSITVPTLIIWGRDDRISPLTNCQLLHSAIHGSKKIIIEGAPHPCYLDNPDIWHRELVNFLNSPAQ
jgi:abhydrolase domain-containing protein 14